MRVKVGDTWYNSKEVPICIQVSEGEQKQIAEMDRSVAPNGKYAVFPGNWDQDTAREWMKD